MQTKKTRVQNNSINISVEQTWLQAKNSVKIISNENETCTCNVNINNVVRYDINLFLVIILAPAVAIKANYL